MDNPIGNLDFDGRDVLPSKFFLTTQFGKTFQDLRTNNRAFQKEISKYENNHTNNLRLSVNNSLVLANNAGALTQYTDKSEVHSYFMSTTSIPSNSKFEYTDVGVAMVVAHEAVHVKIAAAGVSEDDNHNVYNNYRGDLVDILKEYSSSNNLNLTDH